MKALPRRAAVAAACAVLALGGCSGDDEGDAPPAAESSEATTADPGAGSDGPGAGGGRGKDQGTGKGTGEKEPAEESTTTASPGTDASTGPNQVIEPPGEVELPQEFPRGIALVDGALRSVSQDADRWEASVQVAAPLEETVEDAVIHLMDDGFEQDDREESADRALLVLSSATHRVRLDAVAEDGSTSTVTYTISPARS